MGGGRLLGAGQLRDLAGLLDLQPTKKLGQNFVHDANTVRRIVATAGIEPGETVLEVGPGLGSLTFGLLDAGSSVIAIELDSRLAGQLPVTAAQVHPDAPLTVIEADALAIGAAEVLAHGTPVALVANLPYNVSVPVLLHLLEQLPSLERGLVMVQAEVGERIAAGPGSRVYGSPSVKAAWYGQWRTAGYVSRQVFWPVPNVDSVLVAYERRHEPLGTDVERQRLFALVDAAFGQRRKMLRQALSGVFGSSGAASESLLAADLLPTMRGEELSVHDYLRLVRAG